MRSNLFWLGDEQWSRIQPLLPTDVRGKDRADDRRVVSGSRPAFMALRAMRVVAALPPRQGFASAPDNDHTLDQISADLYHLQCVCLLARSQNSW
jgi:transposase